MASDASRVGGRRLAIDCLTISGLSIGFGVPAFLGMSAAIMAWCGIPFEWPSLGQLLGLTAGIFAFSIMGWPVERSDEHG